jgi:hypothetical protein
MASPVRSSPLAPNLLSIACQTNDIDFVTQALNKGAKPDAETLTWACKSRNIEILTTVIKAGAQSNEETVVAACATKLPEIVKKVLETHPKISPSALGEAEKTGNQSIIAMVKSAQENAYVPSDMLTNACRMRDLDAVLLAIEKGAKPDAQTLTWAFVSADLNIIESVISVGALPDEETLNVAVSSAQFLLVKKAILQGAQATNKTLELAYKTGIADLIKLIENMVITSASILYNPYDLSTAVPIGAKEEKERRVGTTRTEKSAKKSETLLPEPIHPSSSKPLPRPRPKIQSTPLMPPQQIQPPSNSKLPPPITSTTQQIQSPSKPAIPADMLTIACKTGDFLTVQTAIEKGAQPDADTLNWAIKTRDLDIIKAVAMTRAQCNGQTLSEAFGTGNIHIVKFVYEKLNAKPNQETLNWAIGGYSKKILDGFDWLEDKKIRMDDPDRPMHCFYLFVQKAVEIGCKPTSETLSLVLKVGRQYTISRKYPILPCDIVINAGAKPDHETLDLAIACGNERIVLQMIKEAGAQVNEKLLDVAITHGWISVTQNIQGIKPTPDALTKACRFRGNDYSDKKLSMSDSKLIHEVIVLGAKADANTFNAIGWLHRDHITHSYTFLSDAAIDELFKAGLRLTKDDLQKLRSRQVTLPKRSHWNSHDYETDKCNRFYGNLCVKAKKYH